MNEIIAQTQRKMHEAKCEDCNSTNIDLDPYTYSQSCLNCGAILEDQIMITSTSTKGMSGGLERQGKVTDMRSTMINFDRDAPENFNANNIYKKESKIKIKLQYIISKLGGDHPQFPIAIDNALRIWRLCFEKKLTRGYDGEHLSAILFYMACRQMQPPLPFLLLDFAAVVEVNVYKLASKFQKLCRDIPIEINSLTDPSIYISRFATMLEFGTDCELVTTTACKLVDQMKQDWITTGRRPSGICGAALLIAGRMHGYKRTCKEISDVVNLSEGTIKKRVNEFLETRCATMTINKFKQFSRDEVNNNAINRKEEELEIPPVMKLQEKRLIKIQKKKEIEIKKKKDIDEYDNKYDDENDDRSVIIMGKEDNDSNNNNNDDDIHSLMKPDPAQHTVFVAAKQTDDEIINGIEINNSKSEIETERETERQIQRTERPLLSDKREMDASDDDIDHDVFSDRNDNDNNEMFFGGPGTMSYITSATRSDLIEDDDNFDDFNNDRSFIVGA
eukprot:247227_1